LDINGDGTLYRVSKFFRENDIKHLEHYYNSFLYDINRIRNKFNNILDGNTVLCGVELSKFYKLKQEKNDIMSALLLSSEMNKPYEEVYTRIKDLRKKHTEIKEIVGE
jgi:hypothetical protein